MKWARKILSLIRTWSTKTWNNFFNDCCRTIICHVLYGMFCTILWIVTKCNVLKYAWYCENYNDTICISMRHKVHRYKISTVSIYHVSCNLSWFRFTFTLRNYGNYQNINLKWHFKITNRNCLSCWLSLWVCMQFKRLLRKLLGLERIGSNVVKTGGHLNAYRFENTINFRNNNAYNIWAME